MSIFYTMAWCTEDIEEALELRGLDKLGLDIQSIQAKAYRGMKHTLSEAGWDAIDTAIDDYIQETQR